MSSKPKIPKVRRVPLPVPQPDEGLPDLHPSLVPKQKIVRNRRTAQQRLFALEYLVDRDARRAALAAGFSENAGTHLLANPNVRALIDVALVKHGQNVEIRAEELVRELGRIALSDIGQIFDENNEIRSIKDLPEDVRRTISSYTEDDKFNKDGEAIGKKKKITLWSKNEAAIALLRMMLETEEAKKRLLEQMSDEDLYREASEALARRQAESEKEIT